MSHLGNGDSGNPGGTTWFGHTDNPPVAPAWICARCGHVERHPSPKQLRKLAKAHRDDKHADKVVA